MREIKFRGIRPHDGKWLYGSLLTGLFHNTVTKEDCCNILDTEEHRDYSCFQDLDDIDTDVITSTVGQFTGLTDKNGKEIYEGDILSGYLDLGKSAVSFKNGSFMWNGELLGYDYTENGLDFFNTSQWATVIGNIHENSDLI